MKKVFRLVHIQLWAVLSDMLSIGNKRSRKPKLLYIGVALLTIFLGAVAFFYCYMIGSGLLMYQCIEILPALIVAITSALVLVTTIFKVRGTIFGFKDYDMVMSLPVSTAGVVASRLIILYSINMLFVVIVMLPMTIVYGILASPTTEFYILSLVMMLFLPMIPIVIASVIGTAITYFASRFRYHNLVTIVISMLVLAGFIGYSFTMNGNTGESLVNISKTLTDQVNSIYPLAGMYTKAVTEYDYMSLMTFLLYSIVLFLLYCGLIGRFFKKINTIIMTGKNISNYKLRELRVSSQWMALYRKEIKRYFSTPLYVLNTGFGIVLLTIGTIALIFVEPGKIFGDQIPTESFVSYIPVFLSFCIVMSSTTAASISLEGKSLWIIKSLPVDIKTIWNAKLAVNLTVLAPAILDAVIISFLFHIGWVKGFLIVLVVIACDLFTAVFGLLVNLALPVFNWTNETVVIKQSAATMISIFTGMAVVGLQFGFLLLVPNLVMAYSCFIITLSVVNIILYRLLIVWGEKRFVQL